MLKVRLLGQYDIQINNKPVEIEGRPAQNLFAFLLYHRGHSYNRERLAGVIWPESSETNARNNLRQALFRLRQTQALGDHILADSTSMGLDPAGEIWFDVAVLDADLPKNAPTRDLRQAVVVYEGEFLPGFYDEWSLQPKEQLGVAFDNKMKRFVDHLVVEEGWADLLEAAERWIDLRYAPEAAYRALMLAYAGLDEPARINEAYARCEASLYEPEAEFQLEPSGATREMYQRLVEGASPTDLLDDLPVIEEPATMATGLELPIFLKEEDAPTPAEEPVFVGREAEIGALNQRLDKALGGRGQVVFLSGDTGRGKTSLLRNFMRQSQGDHPELIALSGDCNAYTGYGDPYLPFRTALGMLAGDAEEAWARGIFSTDQARTLWDHLPETIGAILSSGPDLIGTFLPVRPLLGRASLRSEGDSLWLEGLREHSAQLGGNAYQAKDLLEQYTRVLVELSVNQPILLIVDDLQWADRGSLDLLLHLGRRIEGARIMVLAAFRSEDLTLPQDGKGRGLAIVISEFRRLYGEVEIALDSIGSKAERQFLDEFLDAEPNRLDDSFRAALLERTGGNVLFVVELLRSMQERGNLVKARSGDWEIGQALAWRDLPARVEAVVDERIGRLDLDERRILEVGAVEGVDFTAEVNAGVRRAEVADTIDTLSGVLNRHHRLVSGERVRRIGDEELSRYRFHHSLIQGHIYDQLDPVQRTSTHRDVAIWLEELYGNEVMQIALPLARHFEQAGIAERAATYYFEAGETARNMGANEEAFHHYERALELLSTEPEKENQDLLFSIYTSMGVALNAARGYAAPEVEAAFGRAYELSRHIEDDPQLFSMLYGLRSYYHVRGDYERGTRLGEQLLSYARLNNDPDLLLVAYETLGTPQFYLGELRKARKNFDQVDTLFDADGQRRIMIQMGENFGMTMYCFGALNLWCMGYPDQAAERQAEGLALAKHEDHPYTLAYAHNLSAVYYCARREIDAALHAADIGIELAGQHGFPLWSAAGSVARGWGRVMTGDAEGLEELQLGLERWQATGAGLGVGFFLTLLGEAQGRVGNVEAGLETIEAARAIVHRNREFITDPILLRARGELLMQLEGCEAEAEADLREAISIAEKQHAMALGLAASIRLCQLMARTDRAKEGIKMLVKSYSWFHEGFDSRLLVRASEILDRSK